ncbi:MAG: VOC family protein [Flavobacteriales bacterium]|jgi:catechol 2,3-dioxygenase-like lactoylglutathione lyase family enzyme|nr:VOC family protein [Flavobacteriales bacterium]
MTITSTEFILYVADQARSTAFYRLLLAREPVLNVPGMTEFELAPGVKLGLMPEQGIARIICGPMPHPSVAQGVPRCELYLLVADIEQAMRAADRARAVLVNAPADRDWGHRVAYYADPDGHVIAVAEEIRP